MYDRAESCAWLIARDSTIRLLFFKIVPRSGAATSKQAFSEERRGFGDYGGAAVGSMRASTGLGARVPLLTADELSAREYSKENQQRFHEYSGFTGPTTMRHEHVESIVKSSTIRLLDFSSIRLLRVIAREADTTIWRGTHKGTHEVAVKVSQTPIQCTPYIDCVFRHQVNITRLLQTYYSFA